ncbi:MAG TPA: cytochrome c peroxidase [Stellaceae bacterium]|nr:cytochrome c peroxidase [Stellaceae bacterium]
MRSGGAIATLLGGAFFAVMLGAAAPSAGDRALYTPDELAAIMAHSPLEPPPADPTDGVADNPRAAVLGQKLFFDGGLSVNGAISCAICHQPQRAFTDGRALAKGLAVGTRNAPTLLGAAENHWFFWDGRADSLWSQVPYVIENPREFGSDRLHVAHALYEDPSLRRAYEQVFGPMPALADSGRFPAHGRPENDETAPAARAWDAMTAADRDAVDRIFANVGKAIEAYERKLTGGPSPFDRYVEGLKTGDRAKLAMLSPAAKRGLKLFVGAGHCDLCHAGPNFSDGEFHNIGLPVLPDEAPDTGRAAGIAELRADPFNGIGRFSDDPSAAKDKLAYLPSPQSQLGAFKTPSLRNVALTAPYMHDGRFKTLRDVLEFYAQGEAASRGRLVGAREETLALVPHLTASQISDLTAFLEQLDSTPPPAALTRATGP